MTPAEHSRHHLRAADRFALLGRHHLGGPRSLRAQLSIRLAAFSTRVNTSLFAWFSCSLSFSRSSSETSYRSASSSDCPARGPSVHVLPLLSASHVGPASGPLSGVGRCLRPNAAALPCLWAISSPQCHGGHVECICGSGLSVVRCARQ